MRLCSCVLAAAAMAFASASVADAAPSLADGFRAPPPAARPLARWWWFGPAVVPDELRREVHAMRLGGFGGFEIQPVYPLSPDAPLTGLRNLPYLSPEFLQAVRVAADAAEAEGLRADITLGSGWPYGGPHTPVTEASSQLKMARIALPPGASEAMLPAIDAGERLIGAFVADGSPAAPDPAAIRPVELDPAKPRLAVAPAPRERTLLVFLETRTGQQVKRAGVGAEGFVLDHMSRQAVAHHLSAVAEPLMSAFPRPPYAVFSDSLEVFGADWTDDLLAEFRRRRGYDLAPLLPELFLETADSPALRHDWGLTLSELTDERYLAQIQAWAQAHGARFRSQTYGMPPVTLSSNRLVDLPEGEEADWRRFSDARWASSAAHLYGRPVVSAETFTYLHSPVFRATPLDMKAEADVMLLEGINQFVLHGWPYTPPGASEPGWSFYAAGVFNDHNPWWPVMPEVTGYLQRMSWLLRQGRNVADVAVLLPTDDALAMTRPGRATVNGVMGRFVTPALTAQMLETGFGFDYVDGQAIARAGLPYRVLILPRTSRIDPATYRQVAAFERRGGTVIAVDALPDRGAGFLHASADAAQVKAISAALFRPGARHARQVSENAVGAALKAALAPDLVAAPPELGFVHRKLSDGDLYFVANTANRPISARLRFRAEQPQAQWWDPRTGAVHAWRPGAEVSLAPYESRIFVFGRSASAPVTPVPKSAARATLDLSKGWSVRYDGLGLTGAVDLPTSWAAQPETRFYSGAATYSRTLTLTAAQIAAGQTWLDFGPGSPAEPDTRHNQALLTPPAREAAEVFVDGRRAGAIWAPPFVLDLAPLLHPGENHLEVRVYNTAINALAGRAPPDYRLLNARFGERFTPQDLDKVAALPSGLTHALTLETAP